MYNNKLKYHIKALLGRKNDMWYFDNLLKSYNLDCQKKTIETLLSTKLIYNNNLGTNNNVINSEIIRVGANLRNDSLNKYKNYFIQQKYSVLIQLPPVNESVGGNSFLQNLGIGLDFMGIDVKYFWDNLKYEDLFGVNMILGIGFKPFSDKINWNIINHFNKKSNLKIVLQTTFDIENESEVKKYINYYKTLNVNTFFSFDAEEFNAKFGLKKYFKENSANLISFEFSANPILHYPIFNHDKEFEFIFLGSTNHDKINRYYQYFKPLFTNYTGLIAGPGWPWCNDYNFIGDLDKYLYAKSKTSINLHLDTQIKHKRQLNERSYILAACGIPQIVDNVPLIPDRFDNIGLIANSPSDFSNCMKLLLASNGLQEELSINALNEVYDKHTIFIRIVDFISKIENDLV